MRKEINLNLGECKRNKLLLRKYFDKKPRIHNSK